MSRSLLFHPFGREHLQATYAIFHGHEAFSNVPFETKTWNGQPRNPVCYETQGLVRELGVTHIPTGSETQLGFSGGHQHSSSGMCLESIKCEPTRLHLSVGHARGAGKKKAQARFAP
jgi:hypothetical protein